MAEFEPPADVATALEQQQVESIRRIRALRQKLPGLVLVPGHDHTTYQFDYLVLALDRRRFTQGDIKQGGDQINPCSPSVSRLDKARVDVNVDGAASVRIASADSSRTTSPNADSRTVGWDHRNARRTPGAPATGGSVRN